MTSPDPDAVQILAILLHARECAFARKPLADYSQRHRDGHDAVARYFLTGLANAGLAVTSKES